MAGCVWMAALLCRSLDAHDGSLYKCQVGATGPPAPPHTTPVSSHCACTTSWASRSPLPLPLPLPYRLSPALPAAPLLRPSSRTWSSPTTLRARPLCTRTDLPRASELSPTWRAWFGVSVMRGGPRCSERGPSRLLAAHKLNRATGPPLDHSYSSARYSPSHTWSLIAIQLHTNTTAYWAEPSLVATRPRPHQCHHSSVARARAPQDMRYRSSSVKEATTS
jgi:hypothetical protein